jgi:hypothetical protein
MHAAQVDLPVPSSCPAFWPDIFNMGQKPFKIMYEPKLFRVRVEMALSFIRSQPAPPPEILAKATARLDAEKAQGRIAHCVVHPERLRRFWQALRDLGSRAPPDLGVVSCVVASGAPPLAGLTLTPAPAGANAVALLSIVAPPEDVAAWPLDWVHTCVAARVEELGLDSRLDPACLHAAVLRAASACPQRGVALPRAVDGHRPQRGYELRVDGEGGMIAVVVHDPGKLSSATAFEELICGLREASGALAQRGTARIRFLGKDFRRRLKSAAVGPQRVGVEAPLVLLAIVAVDGRPPYPGHGLLRLRIAGDRYDATIEAFDVDWYDRFPVTIDWLRAEVSRFGVVARIDATLRAELERAIAAKEALTGKLVVCGLRPTAPAGPYLHLAYKDASAGLVSDGIIDFRESQQRTIVRRGGLIAEIRHEEAGCVGKDVFGRVTPPLAGELFDVDLGEGVVQKEPGRFHASVDGMPLVEGNSIQLSQLLEHKGDVNLTSGNIRFDGDVVITGSIDVGAVVEATGHITVNGSIRAALVTSRRGSVVVTEGIVTGDKGLVSAAGNVTAGFIESSRIVAKGDVTARRGILQSQVIAGGKVTVTAGNGLIAGGRVSAWELVEADGIGFPNGAVTRVEVGVDWKVQMRRELRARRLEKVSTLITQLEKAKLELESKSPKQLTPKHQQHKVELKRRLKRAVALVDKLRAHLQAAADAARVNEQARVVARGTLAATARVAVAEKELGTRSAMAVVVRLTSAGVAQMEALAVAS